MVRSTKTSGRRQGKAVTATYGTLTVILLVIIVSVAMALSPPTPPAVAEFAPQAEETIEDAPDNQSSQFGLADGGECAPGQTCEIVVNGRLVTVTGPAQPRPGDPPTVDKAGVRRCVGNPPRQTEDPQSPPCVDYWQGDNGGATWQGVTADEIRVVLPCAEAPFTCAAAAAPQNPFQTLAEHFNSRYELYGRRIKLVPMRVTNATGTADGSQCQTCGDRPEVQQAAAVKADEELQAFASLTYDTTGGNHLSNARTYYDELARRQVMSVVPTPGNRTSAHLLAARPFQWSYGAPFDVAMEATASFMCSQLAGRKAEYAGALTQGLDRKFAAFYTKSFDTRPDLSRLQAGLQACGQTLDIYEIEWADERYSPFPRMKADNVTTALCICSPRAHLDYMNWANKAQYEPEWLFQGIRDQDIDSDQEYQPHFGTQPAHMFGLGNLPKVLPVGDEPWFWFMREQDPAYPFPARANHAMAALYRQLLILASGIQAAGPTLTPATFERGLERARFPNPGAGAAPYFQPHADFGPNDHWMTDDFALVWWTPRPTTPTGTSGICYIDRGARWEPRAWPRHTQRDIRFFDSDAPCR